MTTLSQQLREQSPGCRLVVTTARDEMVFLTAPQEIVVDGVKLVKFRAASVVEDRGFAFWYVQSDQYKTFIDFAGKAGTILDVPKGAVGIKTDVSVEVMVTLLAIASDVIKRKQAAMISWFPPEAIPWTDATWVRYELRNAYRTLACVLERRTGQ